MAALAKENKDLRLKLAAMEKKAMEETPEKRTSASGRSREKLREVEATYKGDKVNVLAIFVGNRAAFVTGVINACESDDAMAFLYFQVAPHLRLYGLLEDHKWPGVKYGILRTSTLGNEYLQWAVEELGPVLFPKKDKPPGDAGSGEAAGVRLAGKDEDARPSKAQGTKN